MPRQHVVILTSEECSGDGRPLTWFHTRGMRKFGRPDLSSTTSRPGTAGR